MSSIDRVKGITYNDRMPAPSLDDPHLYARLDPEGLGSRIAALPDQMRQAWAAASAMEFPKEYHQAGRIVILGMGGSGIGGSLLKALAFDYNRFAKRNAALFKGKSGSTAEWGQTRRLLVGPFSNRKAAQDWLGDYKKAEGDGFLFDSEIGEIVEPLK